MLKAIQKFLTILLLVTGGLYLAYELFLYDRARQLLPPGTVIAGVDVGGVSVPEGTELLNGRFQLPVDLYYRDERVELDPAEVGFQVDVQGMIAEAEAYRDAQEYWQGFTEFLLKHSFEPLTVDLRATHDRELLLERLEMISSFLDQPAKAPQLLVGASSFQYGEPGYVMDVQASLPDVEAALYRPDNRAVDLVIVDEDAPSLNLSLLAENITKQLDAFSGVGSVYVMDLASGEEISVNGDVAISGLSILKVAIFIDAYRALDAPPDEYVQGLFYDTAVHSSNYAANLLLHVIAGENNTYEGAAQLTDFLHRLGLVNTFMAIPYDSNPVANRPSTYITPANTDPDLITRPDTAMQTTAEEMGTLLAMLYYCSQGNGTLLAVYPGEITPDECQAIIDLMVLNEEGNLIRFGVPETVPVSHKHGWDFVTQGDAGLVLSPGGDYVIVEYVTEPESDWLSHEVGFPILREISRATYNYFNFEDPNLEDPAVRAEREAAARA
ncbi:MAG: serine hydrolase, partial [Anaerolineales bacterium]|nr:serine hydrolase [Anaerolineales bacterium]